MKFPWNVFKYFKTPLNPSEIHWNFFDTLGNSLWNPREPPWNPRNSHWNAFHLYHITPHPTAKIWAETPWNSQEFPKASWNAFETPWHLSITWRSENLQNRLSNSPSRETPITSLKLLGIPGTHSFPIKIHWNALKLLLKSEFQTWNTLKYPRTLVKLPETPWKPTLRLSQTSRKILRSN